MAVRVRPARPADLPALSKIGGDAFWMHPDNVFSCPAREEYTEDYYRGYRYAMDANFYARSGRLMVAVEDEGLDERKVEQEGKVLGFAYWEKVKPRTWRNAWRGGKAPAEGHKKTWLRPLLFRYYVTKCNVFWRFDRSRGGTFLGRLLDNDCDDSNERKEHAGEARLEDWPERWDLSFIGVAPEAQSRGVGGLMVAEGVALAESEGLIVSVYLAPVVLEFYRKQGFEMLCTFMKGAQVEGFDMVRTGAAAEKQG